MYIAGRLWWMHVMVCVWLLFAFVLFIAEPFILHRRFRCLATEHPVSPSRGYIAWSYRVRRRDDPGRGCGKSWLVDLLNDQNARRQMAG
jgi:hypothetical protein